MSNHHKILFLKEKFDRQRGQAFLILMVILVLGTATAIYGFVSSNKLTTDADQKTAAALAQAKEALIGYAATHATRPGTLPCPDITNDGQIDTPCNTPATRIGRLPWKSLGLPDLRDGAGERLWYAVSNVFKNSSITGIVNSDISGDFTVNSATGVIAVIFSPGAITASQQRDAANINNVTSYLDGGNESGGPTFTSSGTTNDKLLLITKENLFPAVEQRVIREVGKNLQLHYSNPSATPGDNTNYQYYPYPASFGSTVCDTTTPIYRGRIALSCPSPLSVVTIPPWFSSNRWNEVVVYAVAPKCVPKLITSATPDYTAPPELVSPPAIPDPGKYCLNFGIFFVCFPYTKTIDPASLDCNNTGVPLTLTVSGASASVGALLFSAGPGLGSQNRPSCPSAADCLDDVENKEMPDDYAYTKPQKSAVNNDGLFIVNPPSP